MKDEDKTKEQLINELAELRQRIAELEALDTRHKQVEEALRESEKKYCALFEDSRDAVYITTREGEFVDVNQSTLDLFGYTREEMIGLDVREIYVHPGDRSKFQQEIEQKGSLKDYEVKFHKKDGTEMDCLLTSTVRRANDGSILGYRGIIRDITERKRVEQALRENLAQLSKKNRYDTIISTVTQSVHQSIDLQEVLENAVEVMHQNIDGVENVSIYFVEGEEAVLKAYRGYRDEFIERAERIPYPKGFTWKTIIDGKPRYVADVDKDTVIGPAGRELGTQSYLSMPIRFKDKTVGALNINSLQKNAFEEEDLKMLEMVAHQITIALQNAQQAEALRESEEKIRRILASSPDAITVIDLNGYIIECNQATLNMHGFTTKEELIGKSTFDLIAPKDRQGVAESMERTLKVGFDRNLECTFLTKDGREFPGEFSASVILDSSGNPTSFVAITKDITERKYLEEQLQIRERAISLGFLVEGIAHNFGNLLAIIKMHLEVLRIIPDGLTDAQRKSLETALGGCKQAADLIKMLKTLGGEGVPKLTSVDIYEVANNVFDSLEAGIDINKKIDLTPGEFYVHANPSELSSVLSNIGTNAVQAIKKRGVERGYIGISAEGYNIKGHDKTGLPEGQYVHISFEDNGIGMPEEVRKRVFEPLFTTGENYTKRGQGLGLAIVYNIVKKSGGHIEIESIEGKGTTLHIYLPRVQPEERAKS